MQQRIHKIQLPGGREFNAHQVTLGEMVNLLDTPPQALPEMEVFDRLLLQSEDMTISDLLTFSDATIEDVKDMTEDDLVALAAGCKEANKRFFTMRSQLHQVGLDLLKTIGNDAPAI